MGESIEFPEDQYDSSSRRLEEGFDMLATSPPKIEAKPDPGGNPELAALQISSEKRDSLNDVLQKIEKELSHSLSPNPEERTYKKEDLYGKAADKDATRARLWELGDALEDLERI